MKTVQLFCSTCDLPYEAECEVINSPDWQGIEATGFLVEGCGCVKPSGDELNEEVQQAYAESQGDE